MNDAVKAILLNRATWSALILLITSIGHAFFNFSLEPEEKDFMIDAAVNFAAIVIELSTAIHIGYTVKNRKKK